MLGWLLIACGHRAEVALAPLEGDPYVMIGFVEDLRVPEHGMTDVKISFDQVVRDGEGDACRIASIAVRSRSVVHLPKDATPELRAHEVGHAWLGGAVARELESVLTGSPCDGLSERAAAGMELLERVQYAFDDCTDSGLGPWCEPADVFAAHR